jgi:hypothetical protein
LHPVKEAQSKVADFVWPGFPGLEHRQDFPGRGRQAPALSPPLLIARVKISSFFPLNPGEPLKISVLKYEYIRINELQTYVIKFPRGF